MLDANRRVGETPHGVQALTRTLQRLSQLPTLDVLDAISGGRGPDRRRAVWLTVGVCAPRRTHAAYAAGGDRIMGNFTSVLLMGWGLE